MLPSEHVLFHDSTNFLLNLISGNVLFPAIRISPKPATDRNTVKYFR